MLAADLSSPGEAARVERETRDLDVGLLFAAAGFGTSGPFVEADLELELDMIDVNCRALVQSTHGFAKRFVARGRGGVVLMSSLVAFQGVPRAAAYAATKAFVQTFAEGLARELKPLGVDVLASAPGPVMSGFGARAGMAIGSGQTPEAVARAHPSCARPPDDRPPRPARQGTRGVARAAAPVVPGPGARKGDGRAHPGAIEAGGSARASGRRGMSLDLHDAPAAASPPPRAPLGADELLELARACGADDCGLVSIDDPALAEERRHIARAFPSTRTLLALVLRMNREPVRSPARSVANLEFHRVGHETDDVARRIVRRLEDRGVRTLNPAMAFPMEIERFPERGWIVSHKRVAEAAGLGKMGIHRSLIHPKFGSFVLLGTVLIAEEVDARAAPLAFNPCLECKLCVAACPVGAIKPDGAFDFSACLTHNYQQFMGGFVNFVEDVAASRSVADFRAKQSYAETATRWQSLSYGPNYNAAYCLAACPAGTDVIGPYLADKAAPSQGDRRSADEEDGDGLRQPQHRRRRPRRQAVSAQTDPLGSAERARDLDPRLSRRNAALLPARQVGRARRNLPFHLHRGRSGAGDGGDPRQQASGAGRPSGRGRCRGDGRRRDLAALPRERDLDRPGAGDPRDSGQGTAPAPRRLRTVLSGVSFARVAEAAADRAGRGVSHRTGRCAARREFGFERADAGGPSRLAVARNTPVCSAINSASSSVTRVGQPPLASRAA